MNPPPQIHHHHLHLDPDYGKTTKEVAKIIKTQSVKHDSHFKRGNTRPWGPKDSFKSRVFFSKKMGTMMSRFKVSDKSDKIKFSSTNNERKKDARIKGHVNMSRR